MTGKNSEVTGNVKIAKRVANARSFCMLSITIIESYYKLRGIWASLVII